MSLKILVWVALADFYFNIDFLPHLELTIGQELHAAMYKIKQ